MLIRYVDFANTPDQFQTRMGPQPTFQFSVWCCRTVMRLAKPKIPTDTWSVVVHRRTVVLNRSFLVHSQFQLKLPPNPMAQTGPSRARCAAPLAMYDKNNVHGGPLTMTYKPPRDSSNFHVTRAKVLNRFRGSRDTV